MHVAATWLSHVTSFTAWEEIDDLIQSDRERAWRIVRAMVAYAPDASLLAAVAAGPVESLIHAYEEEVLPRFRDEAARSARFRECLRATYVEWPGDIADLLERDPNHGTALPPVTLADVDATPGEMALLIAWFHHSSTHLAPSLLQSWIDDEPAAAWDVIEVLLRFGDDEPPIRDAVTREAVTPFVRKHGQAFQEPIRAAAERHSWLRIQ